MRNNLKYLLISLLAIGIYYPTTASESTQTFEVINEDKTLENNIDISKTNLTEESLGVKITANSNTSEFTSNNKTIAINSKATPTIVPKLNFRGFFQKYSPQNSISILTIARILGYTKYDTYNFNSPPTDEDEELTYPVYIDEQKFKNILTVLMYAQISGTKEIRKDDNENNDNSSDNSVYQLFQLDDDSDNESSDNESIEDGLDYIQSNIKNNNSPEDDEPDEDNLDNINSAFQFLLENNEILKNSKIIYKNQEMSFKEFIDNHSNEFYETFKNNGSIPSFDYGVDVLGRNLFLDSTGIKVLSSENNTSTTNLKNSNIIISNTQVSKPNKYLGQTDNNLTGLEIITDKNGTANTQLEDTKITISAKTSNETFIINGIKALAKKIDQKGSSINITANNTDITIINLEDTNTLQGTGIALNTSYSEENKNNKNSGDNNQSDTKSNITLNLIGKNNITIGKSFNNATGIEANIDPNSNLSINQDKNSLLNIKLDENKNSIGINFLRNKNYYAGSIENKNNIDAVFNGDVNITATNNNSSIGLQSTTPEEDGTTNITFSKSITINDKYKENISPNFTAISLSGDKNNLTISGLGNVAIAGNINVVNGSTANISILDPHSYIKGAIRSQTPAQENFNSRNASINVDGIISRIESAQGPEYKEALNNFNNYFNTKNTEEFNNKFSQLEFASKQFDFSKKLESISTEIINQIKNNNPDYTTSPEERKQFLQELRFYNETKKEFKEIYSQLYSSLLLYKSSLANNAFKDTDPFEKLEDLKVVNNMLTAFSSAKNPFMQESDYLETMSDLYQNNNKVNELLTKLKNLKQETTNSEEKTILNNAIEKLENPNQIFSLKDSLELGNILLKVDPSLKIADNLNSLEEFYMSSAINNDILEKYFNIETKLINKYTDDTNEKDRLQEYLNTFINSMVKNDDVTSIITYIQDTLITPISQYTDTMEKLYYLNNYKNQSVLPITSEINITLGNNSNALSSEDKPVWNITDTSIINNLTVNKDGVVNFMPPMLNKYEKIIMNKLDGDNGTFVMHGNIVGVLPAMVQVPHYEFTVDKESKNILFAQKGLEVKSINELTGEQLKYLMSDRSNTLYIDKESQGHHHIYFENDATEKATGHDSLLLVASNPDAPKENFKATFSSQNNLIIPVEEQNRPENAWIEKGGFLYKVGRAKDSKVLTINDNNENNWYLFPATKEEKKQDTPLPTPGAQTGISIGQSLILVNKAENSSILHRLGDIHNSNHSLDIWATTYNGRYHSKSTPQTSAYKNIHWGVTVGTDRKSNPTKNLSIYNGAFIGLTRNYDRYKEYDGKTSTNGMNVGLYSTWISTNEWYLDLVGRYSNYKTRANVTNYSDETVLNHKIKNHTLSGSAKTGKRFYVNKDQKWYLEPNAGLDYTRLYKFGYKTTNGLDFKSKNLDSLVGSVGIQGGIANIFTENKNINLYVKYNFEKEFKNKGNYSLNDVPLSINFGNTQRRYGAGFSVDAINKGTSVYLEIEKTDNRRLERNYQINAGIKYSF